MGKEQYANYAVLYMDGSQLKRNEGTSFGTLTQVQADFPDGLIMLASEVTDELIRNSTLDNGQLLPASAEVLEARRQAENAGQAEALRERRNTLLADTDKYMLPDFPIDDQQRELYRVYRRYLREVTQNEGFPQPEIIPFASFVF